MQLLRDNPILLLFLVLALGHVLGRIQIAGFGLGVAAVLFVGLGFGAWDAGLKLPDFVYTFGLTLFVYTMGISSGPGFFTSFRQKGLRENLLVLSVILIAAFFTMALGSLLHFNGAFAAGLFSGALTNTPALAAVLDVLKASGANEASMAAPVVGYSVAYPAGVIGMLFAVFLAAKWSRRHPQGQVAASAGPKADPLLESWVVQVTRSELAAQTIRQLRKKGALRVSFARVKRQDTVMIATDETRLQLGDLVSIVGQLSCLEHAEQFLGERCDEQLDRDRSVIDFRRIFVSKKAVTEKTLDSLEIGARFGAVVTRVRRGDVEFVPNHDTVLEPGDRVRVVAPRQRMEEIAKYLGDSYRALSEIDVVTFSIGIALGLLLGRLPIPLPQGGSFELGFAGGPLIVGLILGRLGRTGSFVWTLPYSANLTLRQLGMVLFLAGIGIRSGYAFATTLQEGGGVWLMMLTGALITFTFAGLIFVVGGLVFKLPFPQLAGIMAGAQTQPAILAYAVEQSGNDQPNMAYATVYPIAMLSKIAIVQFILSGW
jgi:putative transport protein